ncbi:MAG: type II toxin-antitoxin system RelB/DinJ family antitoxin [Lachnospiraceae bacterium]|nr:type II toxin-antitoxin system RelB/DinJ family antitoxin [Lachnospiraceae bacterium]
MANTTAVYARIDTNLKDNAEGILSQLGITPSSAIQMLYSQIVLLKGLPFQLKLPETKAFSAEGLSRTEFDNELKKGVDSIKAGRTNSTEDVDNMFAEEFGI